MSPRLLFLLTAPVRRPFAREARPDRRAACRDTDGAARGEAHPVSTRPTASEMLAGIAPLVGAIPVAGPPVVLLAGPWIFLALVLAGPFAVLVTIVTFVLAVLVLLGALAATPYMLVRHLRAARARHAPPRAVAPPQPSNPPTTVDRAPSPKSVSAPGF